MDPVKAPDISFVKHILLGISHIKKTIPKMFGATQIDSWKKTFQELGTFSQLA